MRRVILIPVATAALVAITAIPVTLTASASAASTPTYTWPEFHNSASLNGVSPDPGISTTNASGLGVKWMSPLGAALDSPMVSYNGAAATTLAYAGGKSGFFEAVDAGTGQIVWSDFLGDAITSSPLVENGNVWIAPQGANKLYKLNGATGAIECVASVMGTVLSTPVLATPPGGVTSVYLGTLGAGTMNGPVAAFAESDCSQMWQWTGYVISGQNTGTWGPFSYGVDASGVGLLLFGSANPDSEVYALNARTGALVWRFATYSPSSEDWDVGAGVDVSAPGTNGFADGIAYVEGKDGIFYALDLTTGSQVWQYNFGKNSPSNPKTTNTDALSTPALSGTTLVFGDASGLYALDALNGNKRWFTKGTGDINSSPAIVGPSGKRVVAYGDLGGYFHVVNLSNGTSLYSYKTGSLVTSSPADVNGNLLIASEDGFLYDFALAGGNGSLPTTVVAAPTQGASIVNPQGSLTISGNASASDGVRSVTVQVEMNGATGPWFNQSTGKFAAALATASATLASPGANSTTWSLKLPVPPQAASYNVLASAVGTNGVADGTAYASVTNAAAVQFNVQASPLAPVVNVTPARLQPGGSASVASTGFAPGESVVFTATTTSGSTVTLATVHADSAGDTASTPITLPGQMPFGPDPVVGTGQSSGDVGSGSVYVSNDDPQLGYGPLHQGFETNDSVIANYQGVDTKVSQGWAFKGQGASDTTPAIDRGVVYFGDAAGSFYAVNETSGALVWSVNTVNAIESDPAVDSGLVFYGGDGGDIHADSAATGARIWRQNIGGNVSSPAVAGGSVYVGTSQGNLVALNESTGAVEWTDVVGGTITSAPAVDTAAGLVVVTSSSGVAEAVSATTGTPAWTDPLGSAVTGPMIDSGDAYVATAGGKVFGLSETTGAVSWTATVSNAVTAAPILAFGRVAIGDAGGAVSYFDASTGSLRSTETQFGFPITGLSFAGSDILLTSSSGNLGMIQGSHYLKMSWKYSASAGYESPGVFLNGDVFVLGEDGFLRAFTTPGRPIE